MVVRRLFFSVNNQTRGNGQRAHAQLLEQFTTILHGLTGAIRAAHVSFFWQGL
jgi:hypothetical protein